MRRRYDIIDNQAGQNINEKKTPVCKKFHTGEDGFAPDI